MHERPDPEKAEKLGDMLRDNLGLDWNADNAGSLYRSCQKIYKKYGPVMGLCIEMLVMRSGMKQAQYFLHNDEIGEGQAHHFALNFSHYLHFTSPIRRYPDVMVHRVLQALLENAGEQAEAEAFQQSSSENNKSASEQVLVCNEKKQATRKCTEQLDRSIFCIYLRARKTWFYTVGTVMGFQTEKGNKDMGFCTVYCSQLGRESKANFKKEDDAGRGPIESLQLFAEGVDDELMLPYNWEICSRGLAKLTW